MSNVTVTVIFQLFLADKISTRGKKMDVDSESTATSIDENTENFCENPTRDTLAEGLMGLIKPTVDQLDERVKATRFQIF